MRNAFDKELELLKLELINMGSAIEQAIDCAITALVQKNTQMAMEAINSDNIIDDMERTIERHCLRLLLKQQPVARDLRMISTALKMITDMERIGDHAADISEITLRISQQEYIKKLVHIPKMAEATKSMLNDAVDAYVKNDIMLAEQVIRNDDIVDDLFIVVRNDLLDLIRQDANNGEQATDLLMIAKYLERIGDHAQNIAEWVVFSITGVHKDQKIM